jgi:hypothetical protein
MSPSAPDDLAAASFSLATFVECQDQHLATGSRKEEEEDEEVTQN